jgi:peroxiredoxin
METIKFNEEAGGFSSDEAILTIGMDLPFAQRSRAKPGILTS